MSRKILSPTVRFIFDGAAAILLTSGNINFSDRPAISVCSFPGAS